MPRKVKIENGGFKPFGGDMRTYAEICGHAKNRKNLTIL